MTFFLFYDINSFKLKTNLDIEKNIVIENIICDKYPVI